MYETETIRQRFREKGIPLLEEGEDPKQWEDIYHKSLDIAKIAHEKIESGESIEIAISKVFDQNLLRVTDLDKDTWQMIGADSYLDWLVIDKDMVIHDYYLILSPRAGFYLYEKVDKQDEGDGCKNFPLACSKIALTKQDAWFFVFRLVYFGYRF